MPIFKNKIHSSKATPSEQSLNSTDKIQAARETNKKTAAIFKGVFKIATLISDFGLRLSFFGGKINASANSLKNMFMNVASSSEEISTSTAQIVEANSTLYETISQISEDAELLNKNAEKSSQILSSIKMENTEMTSFSKDMNQSVQDLLSVINKINETVKDINNISDQTNLLALNASIEAARAGAAGKGFAVVADEIRNLSETTKKLTSNIDALLAEVDVASGKSKNSVAKTLDSIGRVSGSVESVSTVMSASAEATENITSRISQAAQTSKRINDSLQESSAALEAVNNDIQNLTKSTEELEDISGSLKEISVSMSKMEETVGSIAASAGEMVSSKLCGLSNDDFIETVENAIKAHRAWMQNVKGMVRNMVVVPIQTDEHKCGFGHFYYAVKPSSPRLTDLWESVESLHHDLHKTGDSIIALIRKGDSTQAAAAAQKAEKLSNLIIDKFEQMIQKAGEMEGSKELVF